MSHHPSVSDLVLPSQPSLSTLLATLKKQNLSPHNRLRSILRDAAFVASASAALGGRPLVANERCGSWYVDPARKAGSAYFKSTDGHTGQWGFSCRRLNLHLLPLIEENDGCIIVDSTRRGKRMPDALSKTIPIWCAVLNMALFPDLPAHHVLHAPPNVVPPSEHAQITALLPSFLASLLALDLDLPSLRSSLSKPLRPFWVTPDSSASLAPLGAGDALFDDTRPVVCCTASSKASTELGAFEGYVQGAADDAEHWAMGLTAGVFWARADRLLATPEDDLPRVILDMLREEKEGGTAPAPVRVSAWIYVSPLPLPEIAPAGEGGDECQVVFLDSGAATPRDEWVRGPRRMELGLGTPRQASKNLRSALPAISAFVERFLETQRNGGAGPTTPSPAWSVDAVAGDRRPSEEGEGGDGGGREQQQQQGAGGGEGGGDERVEGAVHQQQQQQASSPKIIIACPTGKDLSLATALALHCRFFTPHDALLPGAVEDASLNKAAIRQRLGRMMIAFPEANPQRATLQSVNSFLMDWRG